MMNPVTGLVCGTSSHPCFWQQATPPSEGRSEGKGSSLVSGIDETCHGHKARRAARADADSMSSGVGAEARFGLRRDGDAGDSIPSLRILLESFITRSSSYPTAKKRQKLRREFKEEAVKLTTPSDVTIEDVNTATLGRTMVVISPQQSYTTVLDVAEARALLEGAAAGGVHQCASRSSRPPEYSSTLPIGVPSKLQLATTLKMPFTRMPPCSLDGRVTG